MCLLAGVLQVADLIAMTLQVHKALPRTEKNQVNVDQYTMPTACRKRLKSLQWAPPICYSLPIDPTRTYKVNGCDGLLLSATLTGILRNGLVKFAAPGAVVAHISTWHHGILLCGFTRSAMVLKWICACLLWQSHTIYVVHCVVHMHMCMSG
jgi:hypothetical protein